MAFCRLARSLDQIAPDRAEVADMILADTDGYDHLFAAMCLNDLGMQVDGDEVREHRNSKCGCPKEEN